MSVTINDIAKAANVTKATVSYVINNKPGVSDETRERILKIIEENGFRPNVIARGLAGKTTGIVGLVLPEISDMYFARIIKGVENTANKYDYTLNLSSTHGNPQKEKMLFDLYTSGQVEGIVFVCISLTAEHINYLKQKKVPFVCIDCFVADKSVYNVYVDNEEAGYNAGSYLIKLGHRKMAFIHGLYNSFESKSRFKGFCRALNENNILLPKKGVGQGDFTKTGGYLVTLEFLKLQDRPTAIFAANDQMAMGAIAAITESGFKVPEDISIIGFDDIEAASVVQTPLTTIRQPIEEMGKNATEILFRLINGKDVPETVILHKTELVKRSSCASIGG
ncbi:MAG TPA: hypothetical protein DDW50_14130 [Firmicutes bacterium]|nr:hypothetical protein [Bacillota bacterium]